MKVPTHTITRICTLLGMSSSIVTESMGITKPDHAKIAAMTTTEEVLNALGEIIEVGSEKSELLYKQWEIVALQEALDAQNVDEARKVFDENKCDGEIISEGCLIARIKWDRFSLKEVRKAKTIEQLGEADTRAPSLGRANKMACRKWDILSAKEVSAAKSIKELKKAHNRARNGSAPRRSAIRKIARLLIEAK